MQAYRKGGLTYAQVAEQFAVGQASVSRWLRRVRETGDVAPRPHGGGRQKVLSPKAERFVEKLVREHPDWSEFELTQAVREKLRVLVSETTVGRTVRRLGYSVKKRHSLPPSVTDRTYRNDVGDTKSESAPSPLNVWFLWTKPARISR